MLAPDSSVDLSLVASLIFVGACTVALRRLTAIEHALKLREPPANCSYRIESSSKVSRSTSTEMKTCCGPTPPALQVPDIIHRITEYLDRRSLSIFARCNKACHAVATSDDVWGALMQRELKVSRFPVAPRLQPTQLVAGSCHSDARLPAKLLCRRAAEALMANEQFYEFIRSRDLCAMSSLWLREELDLSQIEGGSDMLQDIFRRYPSMLHHQADGRKCIRPYCAHFGCRQASLCFNSIWQSWYQIFARGMVLIWPELLSGSISACGNFVQLRICEHLVTTTGVRVLGPGVCTTNCFVRAPTFPQRLQQGVPPHNWAWHMMLHDADNSIETPT